MTSPERRALRRKLPAYGRELLELRQRDLVPRRGFAGCHVLVVLDDWHIARNRWRLVIDPKDDLLGLDFVGVAGLEVLLVVDSAKTALERRNAALRAILEGAPASLVELDVRVPHALRFIKSRKLGIELAEFGGRA